MRTFKIEILALVILLAAVILLHLPIMTGRLGTFHNDQAMAEFPWHYFLARSFQKGIIPLWEPDTWCGAIPFYARYYADTYYFPRWPFIFLTRLGDLDQAYWMLSLLPLLIHYFLAGAGMFYFCRRGVRLRPLASLVAAWVYVFSPAFAYSYVWFPIVAVQAWLPWGLLLVVSMDRKIGLWKVLGLAVVLALMFFAAQPPHLGYSIMLYLMLAALLAARRLFRGEKRKALRAPVQVTLGIVLSLILAAVYWYSALEGGAHTEQHIELSLKTITTFDGSLPPPALITLLVPDLFGTVSGIHNWGAAVSLEVRFWEAGLSGGILLSFLALCGAGLVARREQMRRLRFWAWFGAGLWVFAILCVLGRHTPFYPLFYRLVPGISRFPFPIRYRLYQCLATAVLAGLGMESLRYGAARLRPWPGRLVWGFLILVAFSVALALLWPQDLTHEGIGELLPTAAAWAFPGVKEVLVRGEAAWFLKGPISYLLGASALLILSFRGLRGALRARIVALMVALCAFGFSFGALYFGTFSHRYPREEHERSIRPGEQTLLRRVLGPLAAIRQRQDLRWGSNQPFHDNFARLGEDSYAFMGYDMKPLEARFKKAVEKAYSKPVDWPLYWKRWRIVHPGLLSNMSVGYFLDTDPEELFPGGDIFELEETPPLFVHVNPDPLPRAFTLERVVRCSDERQLNELVMGDLREGVFVGEEFKEVAAAIDYEEFIDTMIMENEAGVDSPARFEELQRDNPISRLDLGNPNRVEVEISVSTPAMLVLTEVWFPGWLARVDGAPVPLHRVNYLQRGVWLERGDHRVELEFLPRAWRLGSRVSVISWSALIIFSLGWLAARAAGSMKSRRRS